MFLAILHTSVLVYFQKFQHGSWHMFDSHLKNNCCLNSPSFKNMSSIFCSNVKSYEKDISRKSFGAWSDVRNQNILRKMSTQHLLDVKIYCFLRYTENTERFEALFIFRNLKQKCVKTVYSRECSHAENCFILRSTSL